MRRRLFYTENKENVAKNIELLASEYVGSLVPKAKKHNHGVKIVQESIYELKHKDKTFDVVLLLEVLEHLDYPDKALIKIRRVLKDDGVLILGVLQCYQNLLDIYPLSCSRIAIMARLAHLNNWTPAGLVKFIEKYFGPVLTRKDPISWTLVLASKK